MGEVMTKGKKAALAFSFAVGCVIAAPAMAASCYGAPEISRGVTFWRSASPELKHWILIHDFALFNIAGATCNLAKADRPVREDEFDIAYRRMNPPEELEDAGRGLPNFYRFLAALYLEVVVRSSEAKNYHD